MGRAFVRESDADPGQPGEPTHSLISWTAPLARSLLGREAGDGVTFQGVEAEIVSIEP
jgi:transcription elongation GreA/GreB family factor